MGVNFQVLLKGGAELDRQLKAMSYKTSRNIIKRAVYHSLVPLQKQIRQRIKSDLDSMNAQSRAIYSKQIGISVKPARGGLWGRIKTQSTRVKTKKGIRNFARLAQLFEGGTSPHSIVQPKRKRVIKHPGIKPDPIWSQTFDGMRQKVGDTYRDYIFNEIFKR